MKTEPVFHEQPPGPAKVEVEVTLFENGKEVVSSKDFINLEEPIVNGGDPNQPYDWHLTKGWILNYPKFDSIPMKKLSNYTIQISVDPGVGLPKPIDFQFLLRGGYRM